MKKFAAQLLFQFKVIVDGSPSKRRITQTSIIVLKAKTAQSALALAKKRGKDREYEYLNDEDNNVFFEFIGVQELLHLGVECEEDEVWYDVKERLLPMERRVNFIPKESDLNAFKFE